MLAKQLERYSNRSKNLVGEYQGLNLQAMWVMMAKSLAREMVVLLVIANKVGRQSKAPGIPPDLLSPKDVQ